MEQTTESSISQLETTISERTSLDSHAAAENVFDSPRENFTPSSETSLSDKPSVSDRVFSPEINAAVSDRGISLETNASVSDPDISPEINDITAHKISARLFEGSTICVDDITVLMNAFCSRFSLYDECSTKMHALIKAFLPQGNNFPTGYSQIRRAKKLFEEDVRFLKKSPRQSLCVTGFRFELRDIVQKKFNDIIEYSDQRKESPHLDCNTFVCPPVDLNDDRKVFINLLLFSDGVNIKKSTLRKGLWPVWFQVADLPPRKRMSRQNIVLGALFNGNTTPNWNELVPIINSELLSGVNFKHNGVSFQDFFSIKLLIADLGAKSHMLNMFKFNGFYGCHYCTAPGKTIGKTHAYYPFAKIRKIREPDINNVFVKYAELVPVDELINVAGVNGKSAFSSVINNLPLAAPIDYMHCVLLGVFPEALKLCYRALSSDDKVKVNLVLSNLNCPRKMVAYSKKIRPLDEMAQFKANEYFNWLFYISPLVFSNRIPETLYNHLVNLVFGVRLLFESSKDTNTAAAEKLLLRFCEDIVSIHDGNERVETINVHCLKHLVDQVRRFGPLYCYSAMSFEAANRTIGDVFTGSQNECEIICRRILQRHKFASAQIQDPKLREIFSNLTGNVYIDNASYCDEFIYTSAVKHGKSLYAEADFFNRHYFQNTYFDSPAYARSKHANCFVSFIENTDEVFCQIQYFFTQPGPPFFNEVQAEIKILRTLREIGRMKGFFFEVEETNILKSVPARLMKKVFLFTDLMDDKQCVLCRKIIARLCSNFEHS